MSLLFVVRTYTAYLDNCSRGGGLYNLLLCGRGSRFCGVHHNTARPMTAAGVRRFFWRRLLNFLGVACLPAARPTHIYCARRCTRIAFKDRYNTQGDTHMLFGEFPRCFFIFFIFCNYFYSGKRCNKRKAKCLCGEISTSINRRDLLFPKAATSVVCLFWPLVC